jgi:signal peptidase I
MTLDLVLLLFVATVVTGSILLLDLAHWRRARNAGRLASAWVDYSRALFPLLLAVLLVRSFLVEPFRIPSGSMLPTLLVGDFILVDKTAFGMRIPDLGLTLIQGGEPSRGDVVVFRYPPDPALRYIKRIVGLPGDRVVYRDGRLYLNGSVVDGADLGPSQDPDGSAGTLRRENLGAGDYFVVEGTGRTDREDDFTVPEGHYYVLGDNRDASNDSRSWGPVPESHLIGRAMFVWMSWAPGRDVAWHRIGEDIQ